MTYVCEHSVDKDISITLSPLFLYFSLLVSMHQRDGLRLVGEREVCPWYALAVRSKSMRCLSLSLSLSLDTPKIVARRHKWEARILGARKFVHAESL
jgi:hypothetical protein